MFETSFAKWSTVTPFQSWSSIITAIVFIAAEESSGNLSFLNEQELIYENADAAVEKAWAEYKKGIEEAFTQSQNVKAAVQASAVGSPLATPVSGQQQQVRGGLDFPPPLRRL